MQPTIAYDIGNLQTILASLAGQGKRIGLVPTMGALHNGHASLIALAKEHADAVVVSIFVNPKQFGPSEDFDKYPRMLEADIQKAGEAGAGVIYAPSVSDMYPQGYGTTISVAGIGQMLDGASRPGHFDGVATVVAKLLLRVLPHLAVFGEKDYQQLCVIRRLVADLDMPIEIIGAPTMREADGLAMSSRNAYLSPEERKVASLLYKTLNGIADAIKSGVAIHDAIAQGKKALSQSGFAVDYIELRDGATLEMPKHFAGELRLLAAAKLGNTRLVDNIKVEP